MRLRPPEYLARLSGKGAESEAPQSLDVARISSWLYEARPKQTKRRLPPASGRVKREIEHGLYEINERQPLLCLSTRSRQRMAFV